MDRMQRLSFLQRQVTTQEALEELIEAAEKKEFSVVYPELGAHIDHIIDEYAPKPNLFNKRKREILSLGAYTAIRLHKNVPVRKTGRKYMQHPFQLVDTLLMAGCSDIITILSAYLHDVPEELFKLLRQRGNMRPEAEIIFRITKHLGNVIYLSLSDYVDDNHARSYGNAVMHVVGAVTKKKDELYYPYIGKIFSTRERTLRRAMHVKVADACAKCGELYSPEAAMIRHDEISYDSIVRAYRDRDLDNIRKFIQRTRELGRREHHPRTGTLELKGSDWMKALYKGVIVLLAYRTWCLETGKKDELIESIPLADEIQSKAQEVLDHNATFHCGSRKGQLTPQRCYTIWKEHEDYVRLKRYACITAPAEHPFDGLLLRFFDTSVRGESQFIDSLNGDRPNMQRAAVAFRYIAQQILENPAYYIEGLGTEGLQPVHTVSLVKISSIK